MSEICVITNTSILIFVSTCKQLTQSEPTEFSKNGVFHSKGVVIAFSNYLKSIANLIIFVQPKCVGCEELLTLPSFVRNC